MKKLISFIRLYCSIILGTLSILLFVIGSFEEVVVRKISQSVVDSSNNPFDKIDKLLAFTSDHIKHTSPLLDSFKDITMP